LNRSRLIYLLLIASLFAYMLACFRVSLPGLGVDGMSDGGGLL
jgi:hypothetical protein